MKQFFLLLLSAIMLWPSVANAYDVTVAKDGSGNFSTVQAAIDAAPAGRTVAYIIYIKNGRYKEKITVPSNKPFIQLVGQSVANTIITFDDYAAKYITCSATVGTQNSASVSINAPDFAASNITFQNSYGDGSQAVAVLVNADRAVFNNCRFLGNQDTLYVKGNGTPKCYFKNCYIDGNIDFIFGSAVALFDSCVLYAKTRASVATSYITAPNTPAGQAYGFVFKNARLPINTGGTLYYLSRPWASPSEAQTAQKTVFINAAMSGHILPAGWSVWNANTITGNIYYAEYNSKYFDGTALDISARVPWSYQLNQAQADAYTLQNMFGAWDPCAVQAGICNAAPTDIAVSNFAAVKGSTSSTISWNISWPINGIRYSLLRASDNNTYTEIYNTVADTDSAINFQYTDATVPPVGTSYRYYLVASKAGYASHITDTIQVSNEASIVVNAPASLSLCGLTQVLGTPSPAQSYTIAGSNLTSSINLTPSVNFEISVDGTQWVNSSSTLSIPASAGTVPVTTIYVRLNASATGNYTGSVANITAGDTPITVPLSGRTVPATTSEVLQNWPLVADTTDDAALRSSAVLASIPVLNNLFVSDGSLPAPAGSIPPYSATYGQVFAANAAGNNWQNVGGTLRRTHYQEFTVTAAPGQSVRVDSITFFSDFYGTASGTKMAMVFSKNGFGSPADSAELNDGVGPGGNALSFTASGSFNKAFALLQSNAGPVNYYALSLNSVAGVSLSPNESLHIRLYWACSSTGTPRFAMLKNVSVKGVVTTPLPVSLLYFNALYYNNNVQLSFSTAQEINMNGFEVERSTDGNHFATIGFMEANNTSGQHRYVFNDGDKRLSGTVYYRLKLINKNGSFVYSNTQSIQIPFADKLKAIPNVVRETLNVFHHKAGQAAKIEIYAVDGRAIMHASVAKGSAQTVVDVSAFPPGIYNLVFVNNGVVEFVRFMKQ